MNNKENTIDFVRETSVNMYGKEIFFYDKDLDKWYSRIHCDYVNFEEVLSILKKDIFSLLDWR